MITHVKPQRKQLRNAEQTAHALSSFTGKAMLMTVNDRVVARMGRRMRL